MEVEPQQLDGGQTVHGPEVNSQRRTSIVIPDGGIAGADQSTCASLAEDQEPQPPKKPGSGSGGGGGDAHAGTVDERALEASTAHDAGGNDVCRGDECSNQSLEVDDGIDRGSRGLVKDTCHESEADNDGNARKNNRSFSPNSAFICRDPEEHVEGTHDESSEADGGSDASSDAWDPDDDNYRKPARKSARIASPANGAARRCAAPAAGAPRSQHSRAGDAAGAARAKSKGGAKRPHTKRQQTLCQHGRRPYTCKDCGGTGICEHGRQRRFCKECGGAGICQHGKRRVCCKDCGGSQLCEHGRKRYTCKDCGGAGLCEHGAAARTAVDQVCASTSGSAIFVRSVAVEAYVSTAGNVATAKTASSKAM
eukprot:TRINITY_DN9442_c0_g4_i1.p1 TRINITY_DN9442_c0_g4~~TRINITY_DN9442_c0_g4_i1.p1  ORF type:complete len:367 (+),score=47.87 TRINITY_DN9442_c0_g4_i1:408-1508(+)